MIRVGRSQAPMRTGSSKVGRFISKWAEVIAGRRRMQRSENIFNRGNRERRGGQRSRSPIQTDPDQNSIVSGRNVKGYAFIATFPNLRRGRSSMFNGSE